ncbi:MAG: pyocin knob domain-containing protein [Oscillospiraceae bacterium]|nr:pyocin knob domain-containing protein [Oscillospiraceae bacterium]
MYTVKQKTVFTKPIKDGSIQTCYLMHITVDAIADIPDAKENWLAGSRCDVLEDGGHVYELSNGREWVKVNFYNLGGESDSTDLSDYYTMSQTDERITEKIAEIVADAPEDFDTLKELSNWIYSHEDFAAAMNTQIQQNATDISQKVDKIPGMGLSQNSFTDAEKQKLESLANYDDTNLNSQVNAIETILGTSFLQKDDISGDSGDDLNNATESGIYRFIGIPANAPVSADYGMLLVFKTKAANYYLAQIAITYCSSSFGTSSSSGVFIRATNKSSRTWSAWKKISLIDIA